MTTMDTRQPSRETLEYVLHHVFMPPQVPQSDYVDDQAHNGDVAICQLAYDAAVSFRAHLLEHQRAKWDFVTEMLFKLLETTQNFTKQGITNNVLALEEGGTLAIRIRAQNAALIMRRGEAYMIFEAFEASPLPEAVMAAEGKLICSYPGPAIQVPLSIAQDPFFVEQLVNFLGHMDVDQFEDAVATSTKAGSTVQETRSTTDPKYITQLLIAILHGIGEEAEIERITKRIADDVCWLNARNPWRRSPVWLILRVAVQTTSQSRDIYKAWMLYFHARLVQLFHKHHFSTDLLHTSRTKMSRRAYKLGNAAPESLLAEVHDIGQAIKQCLEERWLQEQSLQSQSPPFISAHPTSDQDTQLSLLKSSEYLSRVLCPQELDDTPETFHPSHQPRFQQLSEAFQDGLMKAVAADPFIFLADFESLVQDGLGAWLQDNKDEESACSFLGSCLQQYILAANTHYKSNPEDQSIMILTILDLWVALDTIACDRIPLLRSYSPEIPSSIVEHLLLRNAAFIERAANIERYIQTRQSKCDSALTPIYSEEITPTTFSVRYFGESSHLKDLKLSIEKDASTKRSLKRAELKELNAEHARLTQQFDSQECHSYREINRWGETHWVHYKKRCSRCQLWDQASRMRISVDEWPLPSKIVDAEATVFELACPPAFAIWRDCTYTISRDIGMAHIAAEATMDAHALNSYADLEKWATNTTFRRIVFVSPSKSFVNSHYRDTSIPANDDKVCVNNGFNFTLYDKTKSEYAHSKYHIDIDAYCTLPLCEGAYRNLQYAVTGTNHSHNSTIVTQNNCPIDLNIHEQLAFANLRCGAKLQWMNILRELRTRTLTFSSHDVHTLITQAAWQIGPLFKNSSDRTSHAELALHDFGRALIEESTELLKHVEENWAEGNTIKTIIYINSRLLTSTTDLGVCERGYTFLRKARQTTYKWMRQILHKLKDVHDDKARSELQIRASDMAATCRATFDVDRGPHLTALLSSKEDIAILIECTFVIYDNTPPHLGTTVPALQRLLSRDRRLSLFLESTLVTHILGDRLGLDKAISAFWSQYHPGDTWELLPQPNSRWITSSTNPGANRRKQRIHYNVLSGQFLIDSKPLGRLPQEIVGHPSYKRLFNQENFDVIPADMPGMEYATRSLGERAFGYELYFASRKNANPVIRARERSGNIFEIIPHSVFTDDFPSFFSTDYVHWMDITTGEIEFRPCGQMWQQSSTHWRLTFAVDSPSYMINGGSKCRMVDIRSETFRGIASRLRPLEHARYLQILANKNETLRVSVELPRFRLSFFLNTDGDLESNNMQDMVIDSNQCTGTMIGLSSQLVLRHKEPDFASLPRSRVVLIPYGAVRHSISSSGNHVRVHIDTPSETPSERQVIWHKYEIDTDLGFLVGNTTLTSRLFRIYLHAICSHPLPDPLTSQRGTDFALQELRAAGSYSFQQLGGTDVELLRLISEISPNRQYYPAHLRVMQSTIWSHLLPVLSQHTSFAAEVNKVLQYSQSLTVFPELGGRNIPKETRGESFLMSRATMRNAVYYAAKIGLSSVCDHRHQFQDHSHDNPGAREAVKIAQLTYAWAIGLVPLASTNFDILEAFQRWRIMKGSHDQWLAIYELCRQIDQPHSAKFKLAFSFAAIAYNNDSDSLMHILVFLSCAIIKPCDLPMTPRHTSFNLGDGFEPRRERVLALVRSKCHSLEDSPSWWLCRHQDESPAVFRDRVHTHYRDNSGRIINDVVEQYMNQWPNSPIFGTESQNWFSSPDMIEVNEYCASCSRNSELKRFVSQLSCVLQDNRTAFPGQVTSCLQFSPMFSITPNPLSSPLTLEGLLSARSAPTAPHFLPIQHNFSDLDHLISQFGRNHTKPLHQLYLGRLRESRKDLRSQSHEYHIPFLDICVKYRQECLNRLYKLYVQVNNALVPLTQTEKILEGAGMWPSISQRTILQNLASTYSEKLSPEWLEILIALGQVFIEYQHSQRLVGFSLRADVNNFKKEVANASFNYPDARQYPEWLLIQIQGNFITRPIQSRVAAEMISPSSEQNITLQLNMGEGKSHVIVPLVAAALADSQKLVRVVVLKPLAKAMFQLLVERLSGLANRRIYYFPFSRDVKMDLQTIANVRNLFEECARVRGVLVAQPEHILSFRLMVVDQTLSSSGPELSQTALDLQVAQRWLNSASRDILDESDELLHIRYQLIYTVGQQQPMDDSPDRWITTQKIFDLVLKYIPVLQRSFPQDVEVAEHQTMAEFPHFRLLGGPASQVLVSGIANNALNGFLENLTFVGLGSQGDLRSDIVRFMTCKEIDFRTYHKVRDTYEATGLWKGLLLLRGLLAHGIVVYALSRRRWRVDYGLDPTRSLLAVPFRAKDVPSLRSEFGHPDVVICLTCLSYYYAGLTPAQVRECFDLVNQLDNPSLEYTHWVKQGGNGIPDSIRQLIGVNMEDVNTFMRTVVPHYQTNKATIDFYLSRVVFPKEAKEFPFKLGTSGWDLAEKKANVTTGFSGTNDNADLLPTSITQTDPVHQLQTNAQVLEYLLRPENGRYLCPTGTNGLPCSASELLMELMKESKEIRVLLDVGAQILEMTNRQLVEHWLPLTCPENVAAGIFFDDSDNLSVLTRDGLVEPLHSSPFFQRLYQCIIYLDDAHTRGTDLKLPPDFRALVTLGPKVTKDKLVQGCMRMRNLGHGQSVCFYAPPEIDRQIRKIEDIRTADQVNVTDVLSWAMANTCTDIEDHIPHWIQQGFYYRQRQDGNLAFAATPDQAFEVLKNAWLQPAARNLQESYGLRTGGVSTQDMLKDDALMQDRLKLLGVEDVSDEVIAEEQEREISHELEEESQVERPPPILAATHKLHPEVRDFVECGSIRPQSKIFLPLMTPLRTKVQTLQPQNPWAKQLLATRDFLCTTGTENTFLTDYLRPVNWVVSHICDNGDILLVVMSPFEVNALLEDIRQSRFVRLHVYAPRTSRYMNSFDNLSIYCVPPLKCGHASQVSLFNDVGYQFNLWSGQLYLENYESYLRLCLLLGVSSSESEANNSAENDRFIPQAGRSKEMMEVCLFEKSPLPLLKVLYGLRRKGMSFQSTHIGKILHARILFPEDFEL